MPTKYTYMHEAATEMCLLKTNTKGTCWNTPLTHPTK